MDPEVRRHLEAGFKLLDADGSGFLEEAEGLAIGKFLGCAQPGQYWAELCKLDTDGDGRVSLEEYLACMAGLSAQAALMLKIDIDALRAKMAMRSPRVTAEERQEPRVPKVAPEVAPTTDATPFRSSPRLPPLSPRSSRRSRPQKCDTRAAIEARCGEQRLINAERQEALNRLESQIAAQRADKRIPGLENTLRYAELIVEAIQAQIDEAAAEKAEAERKRAEIFAESPPEAEAPTDEREGALTDVQAGGAGGSVASSLLPPVLPTNSNATSPRRRLRPPLIDSLRERELRVRASRLQHVRTREITAAENELLQLRSTGVRRRVQIERGRVGLSCAEGYVEQLEGFIRRYSSLADALSTQLGNKIRLETAKKNAKYALEAEARAKSLQLLRASDDMLRSSTIYESEHRRP